MKSKRFASIYFIGILITSIFTGILIPSLTYSVKASGIEPLFSGGSGTASDPYRISNVTELQWMGNSSNLDKHFILVNDINASSTKTWNTGAGFVPIGTSSNRFKGSLDGRGYEIIGLFINRSTINFSGLFGCTDMDGVVKNIGLIKCQVRGRSYVGGIVGWNFGSVLESYLIGNITGLYGVGGLVGRNSGMITNSYTIGTIDCTGGGVGGLVSTSNGEEVYGDVINSHYNIDEVLIDGSHILTLGGLFNDQYQDWFQNNFSLNISDYNTVLVPSGQYYNVSNVQGLKDILGFTGVHKYKFRLEKDIDLSNTTGLYIPYFAACEFNGMNHTISNLNINVSSISDLGFIGYNYKGTIKNIRIFDINLKGYYNIGGVVGFNIGGNLSNLNFTGLLTGSNNIGGIVGLNYQGYVNDSFSKGFLLKDEEYWGSSIGGLVGNNKEGIISNSFATCNITGDSLLGGLSGYNNHGIITDSYSFTNIEGKSQLGGLVGWNRYNGTIIRSYGFGTVKGTGYQSGGLVGLNEDSNVSNSYSLCNVEGYQDCGGLIGKNDNGILTNSYAKGNTTGFLRVGGLIGWNDYGTVNNSYATGKIIGTNVVGGLIGGNTGTILKSFWDKDTSTLKTSNGGSGKTTIEMKNRSLYTDNGWDFIKVWSMLEEETYPRLRWQDGGYPLANAGSDVNLREGVIFTFNGTKSKDNAGIVNYTWRFTDKTLVELYGVQPKYQFKNPGVFLVYLLVKNQIDNMDEDTMTVTVLEITRPIADAGSNQTVNEGTVVIFNGSLSSDNVGIVNWTWTFFNGAENITLFGSTPSYTFNVPGKYQVNLNVTDEAGNWDKDIMNVMVLDITSPIGNAGTDQIVNEGTDVIFNGSTSSDNVGVVNWTWTFYNGAVNITLFGPTPSHTFNFPGIYLVTLNVTDAAGNWDIDRMNVTVNDITPPIPDAGNDVIINEDTKYIFNGNNSYDNVGIINYTWTFIDIVQVFLYGPQPEYLFSNPGSFVVTLNVYDAAGNLNTTTVNVTVKDITKPLVNAGLDQIINEGGTVIFDGSGSLDNVGILIFKWSFFDGLNDEILYGIAPSHKFLVPGIFIITLNATDAAGNWHTDKMTVTVNDITRPLANAGSDQIINEGETIVLDGSGSFDNVGIVNHTWTFNNGINDIKLYGEIESYTFKVPGIYIVTLNITDAVGLWNVDTITVTVNDITRPIANAGSDQLINEGETIVLDGNGSFDNVGIVNYTWTFYDGIDDIRLFGKSISHTFKVPGIHIITLNVSDEVGLWNIAMITVIVKDITGPIANAGLDQKIDEGTTIDLDGSESFDNVGIVNHTWTFYDGLSNIVLYGETTSHTFIVPGEYLVILNVSDEKGHWATDSITVTVRDITRPIVDAGTDKTVDEGTEVSFDAIGSSDNVGIINNTWMFIDGSLITLYGLQAEYQFNYPGVFLVILNVSDAAGNWATGTMTVTVRDITSPVANAGSDQRIAVGTTVILDGSWSADNVGIVRYSWKFIYDGSERTVDESGFEFVFDKAGTYEIELMVYDAYDHTGKDVVIITVIDTGSVKGTVLDPKGNPVEGAKVEIRASNGQTYSMTTGPNGSFSIEVFYGDFTWTITKKGYSTISGTGSVDAMGTTEIVLSGTPLMKEETKGPSIILFIVLAVILMLIIIGIAIFLLTRRKKGEPSEEGKEKMEDLPVEDKEAGPSTEGSITAEDPLYGGPPPEGGFSQKVGVEEPGSDQDPIEANGKEPVPEEKDPLSILDDGVNTQA